MDRHVEGPPNIWSSAKEAAAWLGHTTRQFRIEAEAYPHLLPHQVFGNSFKWYWLDLFIYAHLRAAGRCGPAAETKKKS